MSTISGIDLGTRLLHETRRKLEEETLNTIREVLPDRAILEACRACGFVFRKRLLTPTVVVLHMILSALWPEDSLNASWEVLWSSLVGHLPEAKGRSPNRGSVAKARQRMPLSAWERLFAWVGDLTQELSRPLDRWRDLRVVLLDGTTVSMPDFPALFAAFGRGRGRHGKYKYPLARLMCLSLAQTMTVIAYRLDRYYMSEPALARELLPLLRPGDVLIGDRRFAGAHYYVAYLAHGADYVTRVHQRLKIRRLRKVRQLGKADFIVEMPISKKARKEDPQLPTVITVRLLQAAVRTRGHRTVVWLATSLLDATRYPADEIIALYARRWHIETLFHEVKIELGADVLRSQTPDGIRKEVAARLLAVNIVRTLILKAALAHGIDPLRISFVHAVRAILAFAPAMALESLRKLPAIYTAMLHEIAAHTVPSRPDRNEPRAVRRERHHYPALATTRAEWRRNHAA